MILIFLENIADNLQRLHFPPQLPSRTFFQDSSPFLCNTCLRNAVPPLTLGMGLIDLRVIPFHQAVISSAMWELLSSGQWDTESWLGVSRNDSEILKKPKKRLFFSSLDIAEYVHVSHCLINFESVSLFLEGTSILINTVILSHFYRWWYWRS